VNCLQQAWSQHQQELRRWAEHRLGNPADAEDLVQDIFLKTLRQGSRFCTVQNARAWLYEVARNALADRLRVAREMVELPQDLQAPDEQAAAVDELTACLPRVLSELSAEDREAITLCDLEGMPQAEYARRKGLSLSAAKSRLQRARQRLRAHMIQACRIQIDPTGHVTDFVPRG
jgi:RNA polymerase sigma-70 factor (ECF subfamily)